MVELAETSMLSKVHKKNSVGANNVEKFIPPDPDRLRDLVEEKRQTAERERILQAAGNDPLGAAKREAHRILQEAQEKLKEAEVEAALIIQKKEEEWRIKKQSEMEKEIQLRIAEIKENYYRSIEELIKVREQLFKESKKELLELVFSIAKKVLQAELSVNPQHILTMLESGFVKLKGAHKFQVFIHPEDYKVIASRLELLQDLGGQSAEINLIPDEHIERGGCRIVSEKGEITTELSRQLEVIRKEL